MYPKVPLSEWTWTPYNELMRFLASSLKENLIRIPSHWTALKMSNSRFAQGHSRKYQSFLPVYRCLSHGNVYSILFTWQIIPRKIVHILFPVVLRPRRVFLLFVHSPSLLRHSHIQYFCTRALGFDRFPWANMESHRWEWQTPLVDQCSVYGKSFAVSEWPINS